VPESIKTDIQFVYVKDVKGSTCHFLKPRTAAFTRKGTSQSSHVRLESHSQGTTVIASLATPYMFRTGLPIKTEVFAGMFMVMENHTRSIPVKYPTDTVLAPYAQANPDLQPGNLTGTNVSRSMNKHKGRPLIGSLPARCVGERLQ
jgi:hypothetical protein